MKRVLLIEDNEHHAHLIATLLTRAGMEVVTVETGEAGIQIGTLENFDCVLCDIRLPGMDGLEFAGKARELKSFNGIPLVGLSSMALDHHNREAKKAGFTHFMEKPFDPSFARQVLDIINAQ